MLENGIIVEVLDMEEAEDILGLMDWNTATPSTPRNVKIPKPMSPKYRKLKEKCRILGLKVSGRHNDLKRRVIE